jgi:Zn-dependent peptidase ImmA (M78 family)
MNIQAYPETNLAARLLKKKSLAPPVDIFLLAKQYAEVRVMPIPFDVDGVSLNLKVPKKTPRIIINDTGFPNRIRFTLAHELGHVLIPWHLGSIVDSTQLPPPEDPFDDYWYLEAEASRFASELLMPSSWVKSIIEEEKYDVHKITEQVVNEADVSSQAATIKIKDTISPGYLFAALTEDNHVIFSGRSEGTLASPPTWGEQIAPDKLFAFCQTQHQFEVNGFRYHWWVFDKNIPVPRSATLSDWRELLDQIVAETGIPLSKRAKVKQSLNGIIAYANSRVIGKNRTPESLYSAVLQRIHGHREFNKIINHPKFDSFIYSKINSLLNR